MTAAHGDPQGEPTAPCNATAPHTNRIKLLPAGGLPGRRICRARKGLKPHRRPSHSPRYSRCPDIALSMPRTTAALAIDTALSIASPISCLCSGPNSPRT